MRLVHSRSGPQLARRTHEPAPEAYRTFFDLGPEACLVTDPDGVIVDASRAAEGLLGVRKPALVGLRLGGLAARGSRARLLALIGEARSGGRPRGERPLRLRSPGGPCVDVDALARALEWHDDGLVLWSLRDATARRRAERTLRARVRALAGRCLRAREEENRRIAHVLHDEAGQITGCVHLLLSELEEDAPGPLRPRIRQARALLRHAEDRLRRLSHELRPTVLDDLGLAAALGFLAEGFSARTGIPVEVKGDHGDERLDPPVETALYRMAQEAFANVQRHARARQVVVELRRKHGRLRCVIRDDGAGFRAGPRAGGLGLLGMRERLAALGGSLRVRSTPGRGTELVAVVPARRRRSPAAS